VKPIGELKNKKVKPLYIFFLKEVKPVYGSCISQVFNQFYKFSNW